MHIAVGDGEAAVAQGVAHHSDTRPTLQRMTGMGWDDDHLNQFLIHGKLYEVYQPGGMTFGDGWPRGYPVIPLYSI